MRLLVAAAGSGGHIYPGLAVASAVTEAREAEVLFVGTSAGMESRIVPAHGMPLELTRVPRLRGRSLSRLALALLDLGPSLYRMRRLIRRFRPDVLFGTGGSVSGVATLAARLCRVPSLILEPNAQPGLATRWSAPFATRLALGWEGPLIRRHRQAFLSGIPVRAEFFRMAPPPGELSDEVSVLVTGGSQGASRLNRLVTASLAHLSGMTRPLRITHQCGPVDEARVRAAYESAGLAAAVTSYIEDMPRAMEAADIVVGRAGAITCAEVMASGRAAILVPAPVAGAHQRDNAETLAAAGAAIVLDEMAAPGEFARELAGLANNPERRQYMARTASRLVSASATARLSAELLQLAEEPAP